MGEKDRYAYRKVRHAAASVNGKMICISGAPGYSTIHSSVEEYDPASDAWTVRTSIPTRRWGLTADVVHGKIYAVGGADISNQRLGILEEYDPTLDPFCLQGVTQRTTN